MDDEKLDAAHLLTIAEARIAELTSRRTASLERLAKLDDGRETRAHDAALGRKEAIDASAKAARERVALVETIAMLDAALVEAGRRVASARAVAAAERTKAAAERVRDVLAPRVAARFREASAHLDGVKRCLEAELADLSEMARLGAPPNPSLVSANLEFALDFAVHTLHPQRLRAVSLRRSFSELGNSWSTAAVAWAARQLDEPASPDAPEPQTGPLTTADASAALSAASTAMAPQAPPMPRGEAVEEEAA